MIGGCDAVGSQLAVSFQQGSVKGKIDAGAGHHLAFERVAVDVDQRRGQHHARRVDHLRAVAGDIEAGDRAGFDAQACRRQAIVEQNRGAFKHDGGGVGGWRHGAPLAGWLATLGRPGGGVCASRNRRQAVTRARRYIG